MDIMYTFLVDFARPQRTNELLVMQNDALTRVARFVLMNNGKALDVSDVDAVTINAVLPDESRITAEASLLTDDDDEPLNEIIYAIPASMTSAIGKTVVNISLYSRPANADPKLLNSFEFYINTRNELNQDDGDDGDDYAGIRDLINRSIEAVALVEQLIARSTLPNPYPLRIILEDTTYNYDGSHMVTVDFGNLLSRIDDMLRRIIALEEAFPDGCRIIARAITAGRGTYTNPINGVPTSEKASPTTMATNIKTLAVNNYNQGIADTKAIDPTWNTAFTSLTAGAASNLQTKCTKAGWTDLNEIVASTAAKTTAQINTTEDDQIHDFSIIPGVYNKAKVNQKPAWDAGYAWARAHPYGCRVFRDTYEGTSVGVSPDGQAYTGSRDFAYRIYIHKMKDGKSDVVLMHLYFHAWSGANTVWVTCNYNVKSNDGKINKSETVSGNLGRSDENMYLRVYDLNESEYIDITGTLTYGGGGGTGINQGGGISDINADYDSIID